MRDFLERTDALAKAKGLSLRALAPSMDLSVASLFGYRNGSIPISNKAWKKLERAEAEAGLKASVSRDMLEKGSEEIDWDTPLPPEIAGPLMKAAEGARERFEAMMKAEIGGLREEVARLREAFAAANIVPFSPTAERVDLPFVGLVAAGRPSAPLDQADDETKTVPGKWNPKTHFLVRVNGRSMEPDFPDDSLLVCRRLKDGEECKHGQNVICCDGGGAYFKRLSIEKGRHRLVSINPDFPEIVPLSKRPCIAVVVAKVP